MRRSVNAVRAGLRNSFRPVAALMLGAAILAGVVPDVGLTTNARQLSAAEESESMRERILRYLTEIHSPDPEVEEAAWDSLRRLRLPDEQLDLARLLKHPNRLQRLRLVGLLDSATEPLRSELQIELTKDSDRDVRELMLRRLSKAGIPARVESRLREMAKSDRDFQIRQLATTLVPAKAVQQAAATVAGDFQNSGPNERPAGRARRPIEELPPFMRNEEEVRLLSAVEGLGVPPAPGSESDGAESDGAEPRRLSTQDFDTQLRDLEELTNSEPGVFPERRNPEVLDRPIEQPVTPSIVPAMAQFEELLIPKTDAPRGFTGPSGIVPTEQQQDSHFIPVPDRWRLGYPRVDRYGLSYPYTVDYIGTEGHIWDPYNQNVLKGDYPIIGQHTFLNITATSQTLFDYRQTPIGTTPFESTSSAPQEEFFGDPNQFAINQNFFLRMDLNHGNTTAFKPVDWQIRLAPAFNFNELNVKELAVVNPDVREGRRRFRDHSILLQEYFGEVKLADLSPDYDFVSARAGNQLFNSDFRGFIFFDTNRAVRLFGSKYSNRHQFNLLYYDMVEKDTNSGLNTNDDRHQNVLIANYYVQDFIFPGYTAQASFHMNNDSPSTKFDRNNFLVRPDPVGIFQEHRVEAYYFGFAGDGHMGRFNVSNAFYWVTGRDGKNPIGGQQLDINATMAAIELSYDRDWARFRASFFYSSGDGNANDQDAEGFDSIMDNPVFMGGEFSYWQRQAIQLFGVQLVNNRSLVPNLRSSKTQGQSNFVNPGLLMFNLGLDMDLTPKLRTIMNANYLMFDKTEVLSTYTFQSDIDPEIGLDLSVGFEWRPFHNDNAIILFGVSALIPDEGFKDLYSTYDDSDVETLFASFFEAILTY
ncbi:MAG: HEAT repeat domain-containing protein [Planctomycetales bacterium]